MVDTFYQFSGHMVLSYGVFFKHSKFSQNLSNTFEFLKNFILDIFLYIKLFEKQISVIKHLIAK